MSDWESDPDCNSAVQTNYEQNSKQNYRRKSPPSNSYSNRKDNGNHNQRGQRDYNHKETLDIRSDCIGMVIGKGGSNIKRLEADYNVRINLNKDRGTVNVSGKNVADVKNALDNIKDQINKSDSGRGRRDRGHGGNSNNGGYYNDMKGDSGNYRSNDNDLHAGSVQDSNDFNGGASSNNTNDVDYSIDWTDVIKKSEEIQKQKWAKLPPLKKNFYQECPEVANLPKDEVERIRLENSKITISRTFKSQDGSDDDLPNPVWKFEQCFSQYPDLLAEIMKQNFEKPSPIQAQGWPIILKGEDMIGIAQTGTGKTLAFLFPALIHTEYQSIPRCERKGPNILILAPTRELALQIEKEVKKYQFRDMKAACIYGGGNRREQIDNIEKGVEIIICTPGRLNDLVRVNVIDLSTITYVVLDEADRMLDMGFEPQIRVILDGIRPDRQTIMTSATWPAGVRRLAESFMCNPIQVCVGSLDLAATHTVRQIIEILDEDDKYNTVTNFIKNMKPEEKVIIFCSRKIRVSDLSADLTIAGFMCDCIHGSKEQSGREQAIADITSGEVNVLIATDVASRGLDIEDITHVINFDFPQNIEEYVHRVGRTGRAGRTGTSISYLTRADWAIASELISILEEANQEVPDELRDMADRFAKVKERKRDEMSKYNGMRSQRSGGGRGGGYGRSSRY